MNSEDRFRELLSKLLDDECTVEEREELARLCQDDEVRRETMRAELEISELIRHAFTEADDTGQKFAHLVESRLSGNETPDFASLANRLIEGELDSSELDELARHCWRNPADAINLRRDLEWADLIGQASAESRSEEAFVTSLKSRISAAPAADFASLSTRFINGELEPAERDELVRLLRKDHQNAAQLRRDLKWDDLVGQSSAESRSEEKFVAALKSRLSEEQPADFASLSARFINGELEPAERDELVRLLWQDQQNAVQLRHDLKWDDLVGQATAESRNEEAFVKSLATRMWAEQEQDHFVEKTQSKIVSLYPDAAVPSEKNRRISNIISIGTWASAAAAVIALGAFFMVERPGNAIAEIAHATEDVRWNAISHPKPLKHLEAGHYTLDAGVVTLEFPNGAEMTIEGPAEFDLRGENEAFVHSGIAMLDQDERPSTGEEGRKPGFNLQAKGVNMVDTHDTVGINARNNSSTEAIVFNGGAEVCLPRVGNCRNLYDYEAVRVDLKQDKIYDIPYNPRVFARSWEVLAGVERNSGSVRIELPGKKPEQAPSGNEDEVQIFVERDHFLADGKIEVDSLNPGQFADASNTKGKSLEEKGALRSYLLQLWPEDSDKDADLEASVTFDHEVVGVIYSSERLERSDALVGTEMAHNSAEVSSSRGLDKSGTDGDAILLSDDRRTVNLRLQSGSDTDQLDHVRVLVALR